MLEFNATILVSIISFIVFIMIMNAIFYKPVFAIVKKREDFIKNNYDEANDCKQTADELSKDKAEKITKTHQDCRLEVKQKTDETKELANQKVTQARKDAREKLIVEKEKLENDARQLKSDLKDNVITELAKDIEAKIFA